MKILTVFLMFGATLAQCHAYLDGGTGSMLLQLLLGGTAAAVAFLKVYWYKIKSYFKK